MRYIKTDGKHYLNIGVRAFYKGGQPKNMEPKKCLEWKWFNLDDLPKNLFQGTELTLKNFKAEKIY